MVWFVTELWITGDEMEQSFVRRQSTEPFYPAFSGDCLLPPSPYCGNDLVRDFVSSSDCWRWLPVDTWYGRRWVFPVPCLLSGPGGDLAVPGRSDGIELYHSSSTVLHTAWIPHYKWQFYLLALYEGCQWDWWCPLLGLRVQNALGALPQRGAITNGHLLDL